MHFKNNFQSNCMSFKFLLDIWRRASFIFWSWNPSCTYFCYQQMFAQDRFNRTCAYAHSVGYQLHTDTMILQYHVFNSMPVFFGGSFRRMTRPGLMFKASSASTKLACPAFDHGIWWQLIGCVSAVAELLQCQKFCNCMIADFVKISNNV